jgi:predicted dehydrogenase
MGNPDTSVLRVGVVGLGFMGRTHLAAYQAAAAAGMACRVVAVADLDASRITSPSGEIGNLKTGAGGALIDPAEVKIFDDPAALIEDAGVDAVSICTPTDTHCELATAAMYAGKDALVEKPVSLEPDEIRALADLSYRRGVLCMPGMCMRHWPGWPFLRECVRDGRFGRLRGVTMQRLGTRPNWSPSFYADTTRCGGALSDLHIHDADFVLWCLGRPTSVVSTGDLEHVTTIYRVSVDGDPVHAVAEGGWDHAPGYPFTMRYSAVFENAAVTFDVSRTPAVQVHRNGESEPAAVPELGAYDAQVRHFVQAATARRAGRAFELAATLDDAVAVADLLDAERESLRAGREVAFGR